MTGAGFVILAATLSVVPSVPVAGMALILGIDRFMSECRALTNFVGNAVATIVVARWEGSLDLKRLRAAFAGAGGELTETKSDRLCRSRAGPTSPREALNDQGWLRMASAAPRSSLWSSSRKAAGTLRSMVA